jgi:hypothetical protein
MTKPPYGKEDFLVALIANAAAKPFNLALAVGMMAAGVLVGGPVALVLAVTIIIYLAAIGYTFFDEAEAEKVRARVKQDRQKELSSSVKRIDPNSLAPAIASHLLKARATEARIRQAIEANELPYSEVSMEVDSLVQMMEQLSGRAQLLYEGLAESSPAATRQRISSLRGSGKDDLLDALESKLQAEEKMQTQLDAFYDQMERIVIELETVRSSLLSVSASEDAAVQERLAHDVRSLRNEMGALSTGMSAAQELTL